MQKFYRLFYYSYQRSHPALEINTLVKEILKKSIENNFADELTQILVCVQNVFVQSLEGPVDAVRNTYARISIDPRHRGLKIISQGPAETRLFSDWNMCAQILSVSDAAILKVLDAKGAFNPTTLTPHSVQHLLTAVAEIQRRTAPQPHAAVERA